MYFQSQMSTTAQLQYVLRSSTTITVGRAIMGGGGGGNGILTAPKDSVGTFGLFLATLSSTVRCRDGTVHFDEYGNTNIYFSDKKNLFKVRRLLRKFRQHFWWSQGVYGPVCARKWYCQYYQHTHIQIFPILLICIIYLIWYWPC